LARIARRHNLAVIIIVHLNKKEDLSARSRALGGVGFINAPRSAVLVGTDPNDADLKVMVQEKGNLTRRKRAVAFRMKSVRAVHKIVWEEEWAEITADEVLQPKKRHSKLEQAKELLKRRLSDGPALQNDIVEEARALQISERTLNEAKKSVGVRSTKASDKRWRWSLS
jgi:hypothetical protein